MQTRASVMENPWTLILVSITLSFIMSKKVYKKNNSFSLKKKEEKGK